MNTDHHLPATMDALVWSAPQQMTMQQLIPPTPAAGEIVVEVAAAGICGSELSGYLGHNSLRVPPLVMGHEFSGRIVQLGAGVASDWRVGDRVAVNPLQSCSDCVLCRAGLPNLCPQRRLVGVHRPGAFARFVATPAAQCRPLPAAVSDVAGALAEPLACAVRAVQHAHWRGDGPLLILGAGAIGLCCLAVAQQEQAAPVVITDRVARRLELAQAWGADFTIDSGAGDAQEQLRAALPGGAVAVIDAVGADTTRALALQLVRPGGRVVYIGLHAESSPLAANYLVRQEITIQGSFAYTPTDFDVALALLAAGVAAPSPAWVEERPLAAGGEAFAGLVAGTITIPKIILHP